MSVKTFDDLYIEELRDLYSAERQIVEALPKVAKAATSPDLKQAVEKHLAETQGQIERLQTMFDDLGEKPTGHRCKAMEGLIEEAKEIMEEVEKGPVLDAALIAGAQKVEHYEIASYGTCRTFAELLGKANHVDLLQMTLDEETATDEALTELAMSSINEEAASEDAEPAGSRSR